MERYTISVDGKMNIPKDASLLLIRYWRGAWNLCFIILGEFEITVLGSTLENTDEEEYFI